MNATLARLTRLAVDQSNESDSRLLDCFLAGSQPAFRELVYRHGPLVFGVCNRVLRHRQDAEDAFQAVFLVLARRAGDVWPRDAIGSWLYGVAYRVAMKARAIRARRRSREHPLEDVARSEGPQLEPDTAEVIDRVVRKLPEVYRAAVVACDLEGLSRKDAAGQLGWSEGTLSGRLARARKLLAHRLRKAGVALPAAPLAAVLGTNAPVRAGLHETVLEVVTANTAAGVPAPVAVLTEGVVQGMFAFKCKTVAAAVLVVCAVGYGAWSAGAGQFPGTATSPGPVVQVTATGAQPGLTPTPPPPKLPAALEPFQGKWRVTAIRVGDGKEVATAPDEAQNEFEFTGTAMFMPYRDASVGWRREKYTVAVDDTKTPRTIDMIAAGKPVARGIYEFSVTATSCKKCHNPPTADEKYDLLGLCAPGHEYFAGHAAWVQPGLGLRLAIAVEGQRPTKFGGTKEVIEFTLERVRPDWKEERAKLEKEKAQLEAFLKATDPAANKEEFARLAARVKLYQAKLDEDAARMQVEIARAQLAQAQAQVEVSRAHLELATKNLKEAQDRLAAIEKDAKKREPVAPAKDGMAYTVHVRPLAAPEKVIRVKVTGNDTVLEGLAYAAEDMAIKSDSVSVWVVRDKEILPVDLAGITQRGETKTNYVLKAGDQLFVQVKVGK